MKKYKELEKRYNCVITEKPEKGFIAKTIQGEKIHEAETLEEIEEALDFCNQVYYSMMKGPEQGEKIHEAETLEEIEEALDFCNQVYYSMMKGN